MFVPHGRDITQAIFGYNSAAWPRCQLFGDNDAAAGSPRLRPAVVILPGGSYSHHATHEGEAIAQRLALAGVMAFVLHYSLGPTPLAAHVLAEPGRVIAFIRAHAQSFGVDPTQVSILGFSAGGHLAGLSTCDSLRAQKLTSIPQSVGLVYPVVSFEHDVHARCLAAWLGSDASPRARLDASLERQLTADFPRVFVVSACDDVKVAPSHTLALTQACLGHAIAVETHLLAAGGHGFGLGAPGAWDWCARYVEWLTS